MTTTEWQSHLRHLFTTPLIYSLAVPLLVLDLWVALFQVVCFPLYGIPRVRRRPYFVFDRAALPYLNAIEKLHCAYCSYATGVLGFVREVTARTEQYWCPIRHGHAVPAPHGRYRRFFTYGDARAYHRGLGELLAALGPAGRSTRARGRTPPGLSRRRRRS